MTIMEWWRHPNRRSLWGIAWRLPLYLLYVPANAFVCWCDDNL